MRNISEKNRMKFAFATAVLCIAFFLWITHENITEAEVVSDSINANLETLYRLEGVITAVQSVETGQRGYVITGDELYLITYNRGLDSIKQNIDLIFPDRTTSKESESDKQLLLGLIQQKVNFSRHIVNIRMDHGLDSAAKLMQSGHNEIIMNRIRVRIHSMEERLRKEITQWNESREVTVKRTAWEFLALGAIFYIILFINYRVISKELKLRRRNEEVLKFNGSLISSINDPIITNDLNYRITNWNLHAETLYGWKENEVLGKNVYDLLNSEFVDTNAADVMQKIAGDGYWKGEMIHTHKNGEKRIHALVTISAIKSEQGKLQGSVAILTDITGKKETERKLKVLTDNLEREVERKVAELNGVFERITDAFIALDNDWRYSYVNEKAAEMHGRSQEELLGMNIWDIYEDVVDEEFYRALHQARETMQPIKTQLYYSKTGQWFEDLIYPSPEGISVYYHDITERKKAEIALSRAHEKLNSHINNTPMAVIEFNKDLQVVQWSPKASQIFGWTAEEAMQPGFTLYDMVDAEDLSAISAAVHALFTQAMPLALSIKNVTREDMVIHCDWYTSVITNEYGEPAVMALVQDVTARRKTELELLETEQKFRSLVEESMVGVYIIQEGRFTYVNPRLAKILGYEQAEIMNDVAVVDVVSEGDKEKVLENISKRLSGLRKSMHYEFIALHKDGTELNVEVFGTFILYRGEPAVIGSLIEITERHRYLKMLEKSENDLKMLNERFNLVAKATQDAVWDWHIETDTIWGNESFNRLFGLEDGHSIPYSQFLDKVHPDHRQRIQENLKEAIREKKEFVNEELQLRGEDHNYRTFIDKAYILFDDSSRPYRMLGAMQDVTVEKSVQQHLLIEKQLSDSIINGLPGIFYVISRSGKMYRWNRNLELISGYSKEELESIDPMILFPQHEQDKIQGKIENVFLHGEDKIEARFKTKRGEEIPYYFTGMVINYEGEPCLMGIGLDISERERAQKQLEDSEEKFRTLIEQASDGILISNLDGQLTVVNSSATMLTGFSTEELLQMNLRDFLFNEDQTPIAISETELRKGNAIIESLLKHRDGHFVFVESSAKYLSGDRFQVIIRDITERKKAEEEIRMSEHKYRLLFEQNPMPMWMISLPEKNFLAVNDAAVDFYGYTREEFLNLNINDIRPGKERSTTSLIETYKSGIKNSGIWEHKKKDGTVVKVNVLTHDIIYQGKHAKLELANDMTEKLKAEEKLKFSHAQLRQLATHLQSVRESERTHMAREIHDELGQQLTGLKMDIAWISKKISETEPQLKEKIQETLVLVDDTVKTVRRLATQLRPSILDDLGLVAAMEWQSEEFQKRSGIETTFTSNVSKAQVTDEVATGIFRIYQESLTNVMRHSMATKVEANLSFKDGLMMLYITDNGIGFNENEIKNKNTLGLLGMKERTLMMEGSYEISSKPGKGTGVVIVVPLQVKV